MKFSITEINSTNSKNDTSILYEKEASFVAVLDDGESSNTRQQHKPANTPSWRLMDEQSYQQLDRQNQKDGDYPSPPIWASMTDKDYANQRYPGMDDGDHFQEDIQDFMRRNNEDNGNGSPSNRFYKDEGKQLIDRADILNYDR